MTTETLSKEDLSGLHPREIRALVRERKWTRTTQDLAGGYAQANLAILPREAAFDFLLFCVRNPKPCPIVEVTDPGSPIVKRVAKDADLRTDLPGYSVYERGKLTAEVEDITDYWRDDLVGFLIGCSFSFETALLNANVNFKHHEGEKPSCVYVTDVPCVPAGRFFGPLAVSMRSIRQDQVVRAVQVTSRFPATHGAPVHIGDPSVIGIDDLDNISFGTGRVEVKPDEVPVFWACGVTPQAVALESKVEFMITHKSGHLFITDTLSEEIAAF